MIPLVVFFPMAFKTANIQPATRGGPAPEFSIEAGEEQRVKDLAEMLNKEVINIANNVGQIGDVKLMVLAAITVLDKNQDILDEAADSIDLM